LDVGDVISYFGWLFVIVFLDNKMNYIG